MEKILLPFMAILCYGLSIFVKLIPETFEMVYATGINKITIQLLSHFTGVFSFSLGEIIYLSQWVLIPLGFFILIYKIFRGGWKSYLLICLNYLAFAYILFMCLWGFNYGRIPLATKMGLNVSNSTKEELYELNNYLIDQANTLRTEVLLDKNGVMKVNDDYKGVFKRAQKGYLIIQGDYEIFSGSYGLPKPITLSKPMLYTGITGMYFPFTGEANVNIAIPDLLLPATVLHEMAHQRGVAPEDEANFMAYFIGSHHLDSDFKYSSTVLALINSMNALYIVSPEEASKLKTKYSEGLKRDLDNYSKFWIKYQGTVQDVSEQVNDTYLKSNGEEEGTESYGKMVDLLLAENRIVIK